MSAARTVFRYQIRDVVRGRAVFGYALFFLVVTAGLTRFSGGVERALPSVANLVLLIVPLVSVVVGTILLYEGRSFTELVLSHPVRRSSLFVGLWTGTTLPLVLAFLVGVGAPLLVLGVPETHLGPLALVLLAGALLTGVFTALAFLVSVSVGSAARGLGLALILWLLLTVVYDGVVLLGATVFQNQPLERPMLAAMLLNPVDLARTLVLMALDASALMGYTGAVFQDFFGRTSGAVASVASLVAWIGVPYALALRRFRRMDF